MRHPGKAGGGSAAAQLRRAGPPLPVRVQQMGQDHKSAQAQRSLHKQCSKPLPIFRKGSNLEGDVREGQGNRLQVRRAGQRLNRDTGSWGRGEALRGKDSPCRPSAVEDGREEPGALRVSKQAVMPPDKNRTKDKACGLSGTWAPWNQGDSQITPRSKQLDSGIWR